MKKDHPFRGGYWKGKKRAAPDPEWRAKISASLVGKKKSPSHRTAISASRKGDKNPRWKGGRMRVASGHILIHAPNHPDANTNGRVAEHRLVLEKIVGRRLKQGEHVHHVDCNPSNNAPENLWLTSASGNSRAHGSLNLLVSELIRRKIIIFDKIHGIYKIT